MKTHGILFSAPMIRALLNTQPGTTLPIDPSKPWKWQTRRKMKVQPEIRDGFVYNLRNAAGLEFFKKEPWNVERCPNPIGTILYAKETFAFHSDVNGIACVVYRASYPEGTRVALYYENGEGDFGGIGNETVKVATIPAVWKPSIFMPKTAARIWLEVMRVRVERVNEITDADAKAEGAELRGSCYVTGYRYLWNSINGQGSFNSAPWVWVYDLKRIPKPL